MIITFLCFDLVLDFGAADVNAFVSCALYGVLRTYKSLHNVHNHVQNIAAATARCEVGRMEVHTGYSVHTPQMIADCVIRLYLPKFFGMCSRSSIFVLSCTVPYDISRTQPTGSFVFVCRCILGCERKYRVRAIGICRYHPF